MFGSFLMLLFYNNNNTAICKTCDYKLSCGNNLKEMYSSTLYGSSRKYDISCQCHLWENPVLVGFQKIPSGTFLPFSQQICCLVLKDNTAVVPSN